MSVELEIGQVMARWRCFDDDVLVAEFKSVVVAWGEEAYRVLLMNLTGVCLPAWQAKSCWNAAVRRRKRVFSGGGLLTALFRSLNREAGFLKSQMLEDALAGVTLKGTPEVDDLTLLYRRGSFEDYLDQVLATQRADDTKGPAVVLIELDQYDRYVQSCGSSAGNEALMAVSCMLRQCSEPGDMAARFEGGRFALMLNRGDCQRACEVAQRLRCLIEQAVFPGQKKLFTRNLTASLGGSLFSENGRTAQGLIAVAEMHLHLARAEGNRVFSGFSEKRRWVRSKHQSVVEYAVPGGGGFRPGVSHDLSTTGISIGCGAETLQLGAWILLRFRRPFWSSSAQIPAQVCSIRKEQDNDAFRLGVCFKAPPEMVRDFLPDSFKSLISTTGIQGGCEA